MSGFLGWVGGAVGCDGASSRFGESLQRLCHGPRFRPRVVHQDVDVALGVVQRQEPPVDVWHSRDQSVLVATYGRPLMNLPAWRPADAQAIGALYLGHGLEGLPDLDGSFVLVVLDRLRKSMFLLTDRVGSIPVVVSQGPGGVAFGPEAKALFGLVGRTPRLSKEGAVSFLNLGYPVGIQTLFEGVDQLPPGSVFEVDLESYRVAVSSYWDLRFEPRARWGRADGVAALDEALEMAHRAVLSDDPERVHLLLTGGYDSRAVLGYLERIGKPPSEAFTWGVDEILPGSDPAVARAVAESAGVGHRVLHYGIERFSKEAPRWVHISELSSDNMGNFAAGPDFFQDEGLDSEVPVLIADQMLGPGGFPSTAEEAIRNISKVPGTGVRPELAAMMRLDDTAEAGRLLMSQLSGIATSCATDHPKDVQDYLYFHLYVVRWLHASAYFREPMVAPRRPMLLAPVLDVGRQFPRNMRVDKAVLVDLMKKRMPALAGHPIASAHSLVDWDFESRTEGGLRRFFMDLLDWEHMASIPAVDFLDQKRYLAALQSYFSEKPTPVDRRPSQVPRIMAWRRKLAGSRWLGMPARAAEPIAKRILGVAPGKNPGTVLRRLALLSLLQRLIDAGEFASGSGGTLVTPGRNSGAEI